MNYGGCESDYSECGERSRERSLGQHVAIFVDLESVCQDSVSLGMTTHQVTLQKTNTQCQLVLCASALQCIFTSLRARTGNTNFENELLLKLNKAFVQ